MGKQFERMVLKGLLVFGLGAFFNLTRKPPIKDWLIIFFLKSYISTFLDALLVKNGFIKYPVNLLKGFDVSVIFSYLLFPISCVYYNQLTRGSSIPVILLKCLYFSGPMALMEKWLEKNTQLIKYKRSWNWKYSFVSMTCTFLFVRMIIGLINKFSNENKLSKPEEG